jgi:hypothetical protein
MSSGRWPPAEAFMRGARRSKFLAFAIGRSSAYIPVITDSDLYGRRWLRDAPALPPQREGELYVLNQTIYYSTRFPQNYSRH